MFQLAQGRMGLVGQVPSGFAVLPSTGTPSYVVTLTVLSSTGASYTVSSAVLDSAGNSYNPI